MSPLADKYEEQIIDFIKKIRESGFTILENPLSTQIYGEFGAMMTFLTQAMEESFASKIPCLVYLKIVNSDRSDYQPHF